MESKYYHKRTARADRSHAAGLACERNYDAARAALTPTLGLNSGGP